MERNERTMPTTRRALLGAGAGAALLAASTASIAEAAKKPKPYRERKRVDLHAHYLSPEYRAALEGAGITTIGGLPTPDWSPEIALKFMDDYGIAVQMLSVSDPGVDFLAAAEAQTLARRCNDYVAGLVASNPKRFGAFAVLSLQDLDAARAEAIRAMDTLELDGVGLLSSSAGRYLGDPAFDGLLAELDARRAWVFVHPTKLSEDDRPSYQVPDFIAEYPFDTSRTIISLVFNNAFGRYPNIRWHFAHGGGTAPMLRFRIATLARFAPIAADLIGLPEGSKSITEKQALAAIKRSRYDTALIGDKPALDAVRGITSGANVFFGSDFPFAGNLYLASGDPTPALGDAFSNRQRRAVDRLNARREFSRLSFLPKT